MTELKLIFILACLSCWEIRELSAQSVTFVPQRPSAGESIEISYKREVGYLDSLSTIRAVVYFNGDTEFPVAKEIRLERHAGQWKTSFSTNAYTKSIVVVFLDSLDHPDNNEGEGYCTPIYKEGVPVPGALASVAEMYASNWNPEHTYYLKRRLDLAKRLYEEDFSRNPQIKRQFTRYYLATFDLREQDQREQFKIELDAYSRVEDLTEWELKAVSKYYVDLNDTDAAGKYSQEVFNRFPRGSWSIQTKSLPALKAIYLSNDFEERKAIYYGFKQKYCQSFPDDFTKRVMRNRQTQMLGKILEAYPGAQIPEFWNKEILELEEEYQKYAFKEAARMICSETTNYKLAEVFAVRAVELQRIFINAPRLAIERTFVSDEKLKKIRENTLGEYLGLYGKTLLFQKKHKEALPFLEEAAIRRTKRNNANLNEL